jgi:indolepyruvate ferredoxin oxidoreductase
VALSYHKLLAIKDEYEVARLFTAPGFRAALDAQFEGDYRIEFNLAPPLLSQLDPETGRPRKQRYGAWMFGAFRLLSRLRRLRGTAWDPFGRTAERRMERRLIGDYEALIGQLVGQLDTADREVAVALASLPQKVRGFGPVKEASVRAVEVERTRLLQRLAPASENTAPGRPLPVQVSAGDS